MPAMRCLIYRTAEGRWTVLPDGEDLPGGSSGYLMLPISRAAAQTQCDQLNELRRQEAAGGRRAAG